MTGGRTRMEKDSMGEMSLPESALYGASTQRAVLNFPVSGYRFSRPFIRALGLIKWAAAQANHDLGLLDAERAALIVSAAEEVVEGKLDDHFPLDIFQTGSGTSTNTNANEVIANRYAQQVAYAKERAQKSLEILRELALGGTAVGTGLNRNVDLPKKMLRHLEQRTGIAFCEAKNHFEAQGGKDTVVEASGELKTIAVSLFKIANDIRWLGSGPRCGIGEIQLPATQPGSSIMPGKVNPVMCEAMMMVCAQVIGNDTTITWAGANGNFELNVMMPVMAHNLLESIRLLANVVDVFCDKCVRGIVANEERCRELIELSMAMVTSLAPKIGYDRAAEIAKESAKTGRTVREIAREKKVLPEKELERALDPVKMTEPGGSGSE